MHKPMYTLLLCERNSSKGEGYGKEKDVTTLIWKYQNKQWTSKICSFTSPTSRDNELRQGCRPAWRWLLAHCFCNITISFLSTPKLSLVAYISLMKSCVSYSRNYYLLAIVGKCQLLKTLQWRKVCIYGRQYYKWIRKFSICTFWIMLYVQKLDFFVIPIFFPQLCNLRCG